MLILPKMFKLNLREMREKIPKLEKLVFMKDSKILMKIKN